MVSLVIEDEYLLSFANAFKEDTLREAIFCLQDAPMTLDTIAQTLNIKEEDMSPRLDALVSMNLVRRVKSSNGGPDLYALGFAMEKFGGYPKTKLVRTLSEAMSEVIPSFLEQHAGDIESLCESTGISMGRCAEQLFLSVFSWIMGDLQREVLEEDKRLCETLKKSKPPR
jgi:predicted transcriptional regulator